MKTAFITGCSAGFGRATAELLANRGYHVIAGIRNIETSNHLIAGQLAQHPSIEPIELDLASTDSIQRVSDQLKNRRIDVLINNAGVCGTGFTETHSIEKVRQIFEVNVFGLYELTRQMIPIMRRQKEGLIIRVTSIVGRVVMPLWGAYSASKFAVEAFAETWRYELRPLGIDSVIVEPGPHPTTGLGLKMAPLSGEMPAMDVIQQYGSVALSMQEFGAKLKQEIENGTFQKPEGVAHAVLNLIEMPAGKRPMRTVVDKWMNEPLTRLNNFTDAMYQGIYQ